MHQVKVSIGEDHRLSRSAQFIPQHSGLVDEALDRVVLTALEARDAEALARLPREQLNSGNSEIRNWIVVAAAASDLDLTWVSYTPAYRSAALTGTGLGFARWS